MAPLPGGIDNLTMPFSQKTQTHLFSSVYGLAITRSMS
jgi:hypothetical protein